MSAIVILIEIPSDSRPSRFGDRAYNLMQAHYRSPRIDKSENSGRMDLTCITPDYRQGGSLDYMWEGHLAPMWEDALPQKLPLPHGVNNYDFRDFIHTTPQPSVSAHERQAST